MQHTLRIMTLVLVVSIAGCGGKKEDAPRKDLTKYVPPREAVRFILKELPLDAKDVIAIRKQTKNDDDIVVVGRIGGSENPWIKDRSAFTIVDRSLKACNERVGDTCPVPWDFCCELTKLKKAKAFIKFVGADGKLLRKGARALFQVEELQTVFVRGKAIRDKEGNLTVIASGMYVVRGT
jgi:hypothetical protein